MYINAYIYIYIHTCIYLHIYMAEYTKYSKQPEIPGVRDKHN